MAIHDTAATALNSDNFLSDEDSSIWWPVRGIEQHSLSFHTGGYHDDFFSILGIERPDALDRAVPKRKAEFLAGRYCAREVLLRLGERKTFVDICADRQPGWPGGIIGSISHSNGRAAAIASRDKSIVGVGIDIEDLVAPRLVEELHPQVLNSSERQWLNWGELDPAIVFTLIFSIKESFFKALYPLVRRFFGFDAISISAIEPNSRRAHFSINPQSIVGEFLPSADYTAHYHQPSEDSLATCVVIAGETQGGR
ncbi:4'-phosphopantetheinyl transferase [Microbulbifer sp. TYP-18]|uniref:4'-phosphopantetheinyl transferase n=1 Tax=Microbulbifer sp. TYP-18 TaxID=3230024 RepID=UPI0034C68F61